MIKELVCINCPLGCMLTADIHDDGTVEVTGNTCPRGEQYAKKELTNPSRTVTSTVKIMGIDSEVVSVKTASEIPKGKIWECMDALKTVKIKPPVHIGDVIIDNVAGTGVAVVATKNYEKR